LKKTEVIRAWGRILRGYRPNLSIEITRECPLRCPGCYAYEDAHIGNGVNLRQMVDKRGDELVLGVLGLIDRYRPLHVSIVGGEPLVRYRELEVMVPRIQAKGVHVQVVTSAVRALPESWKQRSKLLNIVVSIDGLQPDHDLRRRPATYDRILKNIAGHHITVHCTITGSMTKRSGYLDDFLAFWTPRPEIDKVWMSIFTPQQGAAAPEILSRDERRDVVETLLRLRRDYPKLDMPAALIKEFAAPPSSPAECIFAKTTHTISADLQTHVGPCQFGGTPDCSQCGCIASMGLAAVGNYKVAGRLTAGQIFHRSHAVGERIGAAAAALTRGGSAKAAFTRDGAAHAAADAGRGELTIPIGQRTVESERASSSSLVRIS
jgi:sulfatase maturation enzyme AslB (radical SAM superfamily)